MSGGIVGSGSSGTVFKLSKDGSSYEVLHHFSAGPWFHLPGVIQASDGKLYGTTASYGDDGAGDAIFKLNKDGSDYTVLRSGDMGSPRAPLLEGSDGALYGISYSAGAVFKLNKDGTGYRILHGVSYSTAALIEGTDGALYGTSPE